jgi:hypothetical protein
MMASFVVLELPAQDPWPGGRVLAIRDETRLRAEFAQMMEDLAPPPAPASALQVTPEQLTAMRTSLQMVLGFAELLHRGEYGQMNPSSSRCSATSSTMPNSLPSGWGFRSDHAGHHAPRKIDLTADLLPPLEFIAHACLARRGSRRCRLRQRRKL